MNEFFRDGWRQLLDQRSHKYAFSDFPEAETTLVRINICVCFVDLHVFFLRFQFGRDLQAFSKAALATWPHYAFSCFAGSRHGKFYQKHSSSWIWTQLDGRFILVHPLQWSCFWQVQSENHTVALRNKSGSVTVKSTDPDRLGGKGMLLRFSRKCGNPKITKLQKKWLEPQSYGVFLMFFLLA